MRRNVSVDKETSMTIINLTPHEVTLLDGDGNVVRCIPTSGVARAAKRDRPAAPVDGVPTVRSDFGEVTDLPAPSDGVFYIVSSIAAQAAAASGRPTADLLIPGTVRRDEEGRPLGVTELARVG
jgi:hypothetical protein